ncbi:MAG: hypothetical protein ACHQ4H_11240 [Ktedonobacterales bacterium]
MRRPSARSQMRCHLKRSAAPCSTLAHAGLVLLATVAVCALAACGAAGQRGASNATATVTATAVATATPSATPVPRMLYQADWSHGTDGWTLPPHWRITNGQLTNDGLGDTSILAPVRITVPNYAITARIQVLSITSDGVADTYFGIGGNDASGKQLFLGEASGIWKASPFHSDSTLVTTGDYPDGARVWENVVGPNPKTYRVEVHGSNVTYTPGNVSIGGLHAPYPLSPAQPFIAAASVQLVITSYAIWQL